MVNPFVYLLVLTIGVTCGLFLDGELSAKENLEIKSRLTETENLKNQLSTENKTYQQLSNQFCQQIKDIKK
jgi:hypothetical protein